MVVHINGLAAKPRELPQEGGHGCFPDRYILCIHSTVCRHTLSLGR